MSDKKVCVVGNPNCGKTTLFNALTGANQQVGNWPGVTVDKKTGYYTYNGEEIEIVDLPGIYSITPASTAGEDEKIARDYILTNDAQCVINIIDAANLERNLYLTAQLIEMQIPMLCVVNMLDIAKAHKIEVNLDVLSKELGCPVVGIIASKEQGIEELRRAISNFLKSPTVPPLAVEFDPLITDAAKQVEAILKDAGVDHANWLALQLVENAPGIEEKLPEEAVAKAKKILDPLELAFNNDVDIAVADARYQFVSKIADKAIKRLGESTVTTSDKIDKIVLNRWLGLPIFLLCMYVMFMFVQNLGGCFIDFFDILFGGIFVDGFGELLLSMGCPEWLKVVLADGVGSGIQTVSTFIPPIGFLFLFLSLMEDSGYMARAAFVMDRFMRAIGLPGKAFVPLLIGFGCGVPAIMATRTMDRASDRITTIMMAPFMSCGARLPIYVLFAAVFWPTNGQNLVFALYIAGIIGAIITGFLIKKLALPSESGAFVMEIPPYHIPTFKGVILRTWDRLKAFILRAGKVIVCICAIIGVLNSVGTDGSFGNEDTDKSVLSSIGQTISPIFAPMGVTQENWPAAVGIFTGILAKEAVIGTMSNLYDGMANKINEENAAAAGEAPAEEEEESWSFGAVLSEAVDTTIDNLKNLGSTFADPLGIEVDDDLTMNEERAEELEVTVDSATVMQQLFGSKVAAFAYLLMCLFYMPCVAATAAVYREAGARWTLFLCAWTTAFGYCTATIFYRVGTFSQDPMMAILSIAISAAVFAVMIVWMKSFAKHHPEKKVIPIAVARDSK